MTLAFVPVFSYALCNLSEYSPMVYGKGHAANRIRFPPLNIGMWCEVIAETIFHRQSGTLAFQEYLGYLTEEETAKACVQGGLSNKSHSIGLYGRAVLRV
jgi:hypothetical protein